MFKIEFRMGHEKDFKVFENLELITLRSSIDLITLTRKHYRSCPLADLTSEYSFSIYIQL